MATKTNGDSVRVYVNTGTVGTPVYTPFDCEGTCTLTVNRSVIDTAGKCSGMNAENLGEGVLNYTVDIEGSYAGGDPGADKAFSMVQSTNTHIMWQMKTFYSKVYSGTAQVTSFTVTSAHGDVVKFSTTLTGSGALAWA